MTAAVIDSPSAAVTQLPGRDYISFSAISSFQRCPLAFKFRYLDQLREDVVSASLVFGGAIHSAIELHFNELMAGNPAPDLDTLLYSFQDAWRNRENGSIRFNKGDDENTLGELAERMLRAFQSSSGAVPEGRILGVEEELRGGIIPGVPDILGRIDLLVETSDAVVVTDWKTSRSRWNANQATDNADQLLLYSELVRDLVPGKSLRTQFMVVTKAKTPSVEMHTAAVSPRQIARTKRTVQRVWRAIESGNFYPTPSPMNCSGCPFKAACREWTG